MVTVFTPTYNRAHLLPRLYESICRQTDKDFEWLVIDDGSLDGTEDLFRPWTKADKGFLIRYQKVSNGGKQRAINQAMQLARGEYFFIVDSDDVLATYDIEFIKRAFDGLPKDDESFIGISGLRVCPDGSYIHGEPQIPDVPGYRDCTNLERPLYNMQADMAEVFYTDKLRKYSFPVWPGETFTPEAVVWDQMAMDGYRLRWYKEPIYQCEYQQGGLTDSTWRLLQKNPMGYAMLFNSQLLHTEGIKARINLVLQFISCCCLAGEYGYIRRCHSAWAYVLAPVGWLLSRRRKMQFKQYLS